MTEDSILCVICEKKYGNLTMLKHIAAHLAYYPHFCVDCKFKSYEVHCLVEHEVSTGHNIRQNEHNRYMEKVCSMIYKDCLIATKEGLEAVFKQIIGGKNQVVVTPNTPVSTVRKVVRPRVASSDSSSDSNDDIQLLPRPEPSSAAKHPVHQNKQSSAVPVVKTPVQEKKLSYANQVAKDPVSEKKQSPFVQKTPEVTRSKVIAKADSSSSDGSERGNCLTEMEMAELDRQINRGHMILKCNQCKQDVPNHYKSHKEHVLRNHRSMQTNESKETFIARFIKFCFPMAVAVSDLQCGICGCEAKCGGRKTHINREHLFFYLECPVKACIFNSLCESTIATHLKNAHKITAQELEGEEKAALEKERIAYNAKMKPYLSRCFPCSVSGKGADKQEKEALAEIQRELFSQPANGNNAPEIISPSNANNAAAEPIGIQRRSEDSGRRVSFNQTEVHAVPAKDQRYIENTVASNVAKTPILGDDKNHQPKTNRSKTPQSAFCSKSNDRNKGYDGASNSSRQDRRSSYNRGHRGEISPLRTGSKRSIVSVEGSQSQNVGSAKIQSKFDDSDRQSGNRDNRTSAHSPKKMRCRSSNREPAVTPSGRSIQSNRGQRQVSSFSPSVVVGKQGPAGVTHDFSIPPPFIFNPPSAVTYGNVPMPTDVVVNEDVKFDVPQRLKSPRRGGTIEGLIKQESM